LISPSARVVVLKSRGHFRAAFDEFFADEQIVSVDAPGPDLADPRTFRFQEIGRDRLYRWTTLQRGTQQSVLFSPSSDAR